jgi:predicted nuclease with TOPRIM domain
MTEPTGVAGCNCDPFPTPQGGVCTGCSPNEALTCEEESILTRMRGIKEEVRPIADKLKNIHQEVGQTLEWTELYGQLESLRRQWEAWEKKLADAIEKKLIYLGHREP